MDEHDVKRAASYGLLVIVVLFVITGYGITQYRDVEWLTFGLLTKPLSFAIHDALIIPFIAVLAIHLFYACGLFRRFRNEKGRKDRQ
jgi:hypothetical protein